MKLFSNQSSQSVAARLTALRGELAAAEEAVAAAEAQLEEALAAGGSSEKPLRVLGDAQTRASALASVIGKAQRALDEAQDREERAARLKEILTLEKQGRAKLEALGKRHAGLVASARDLVAEVTAFDQAVLELRQMSGGGLSFRGIPEIDAFEVISACSARPPRDCFEDALGRVDALIASGVVEAGRQFDSEIASGKRRCAEPGA